MCRRTVTNSNEQATSESPNREGLASAKQKQSCSQEGSQWERAQDQPQATKMQGETLWQHIWWEKQGASPKCEHRTTCSTSFPAQQSHVAQHQSFGTLSNAYPPLLNVCYSVFVFTYHLLFPRPCFCTSRCWCYALKNNPLSHLLSKFL